jgi:hypothetical protein
LDLLSRGYRLPLAGGTQAQNQVLANPEYFPRALIVTVDQTVNQGDFVWWDDVHYTLKPLTSTTQVAYTPGTGTGGFAGVAAGSNIPGVYPNPQAGAPSEYLPGVEVQRGGSVRAYSTAGEGSYVPFQPVTIGATAQTVSRGAETTADMVGRIIVPPPTTAGAAAGTTPVPANTVASGGSVEVWVTPTFPISGVLL